MQQGLIKYTAQQSRIAQNLQENLYRMHLIAKASDLEIAELLREAGEKLSPVIAQSIGCSEKQLERGLLTQ
jgi:hypothetical protein